MWRGHDGLGPLQPRPGGATKDGDRPLLFKLIKLLKPMVAIETGCYEAISASIICQALPVSAYFGTFDYDGDPSMPLAEPAPGEDYCTMEEWLELSQIRAENLQALRDQRTDLKIHFHNGDTRQILSRTIGDIVFRCGAWNFWYQDSMHDCDGIRQEWEAMEMYAAPGAVVVFDDIEGHEDGRPSHPWYEYFKANFASRWNYRTTHHANHQLYLQRKP